MSKFSSISSEMLLEMSLDSSQRVRGAFIREDQTVRAASESLTRWLLLREAHALCMRMFLCHCHGTGGWGGVGAACGTFVPSCRQLQTRSKSTHIAPPTPPRDSDAVCTHEGFQA